MQARTSSSGRTSPETSTVWHRLAGHSARTASPPGRRSPAPAVGEGGPVVQQSPPARPSS
eukprot:4959857-Alexandrium_andersonii.AAC.1